MPLLSKNNKSSRHPPPPDVIILCGGLGTRLRPLVSDRPKALADIGGRAFIDLLIEWIRKQGFSRIILSLGYQGEMIRTHMEKGGIPVIFSEENEPLGTGGALKNAWPLVHAPECIVMNGDTFCDIDLKDFIRFHRSHAATMSMVVTTSLRQDGGGMILSDENQIIHFKEKWSAGTKYLNAGIYAFGYNSVSFMPPQPVFSLEYDFFPTLIGKYSCFGYVTKEEAFDIGTPERYHSAIHHFRSDQTLKL